MGTRAKPSFIAGALQMSGPSLKMGTVPEQRPLVSASANWPPGCSGVVIWVVGMAIAGLFVMYGQPWIAALVVISTNISLNRVTSAECLSLGSRGMDLINRLKGRGNPSLPHTSEEEEN